MQEFFYPFHTHFLAWQHKVINNDQKYHFEKNFQKNISQIYKCLSTISAT